MVGVDISNIDARVSDPVTGQSFDVEVNVDITDIFPPSQIFDYDGSCTYTAGGNVFDAQQTEVTLELTLNNDVVESASGVICLPYGTSMDPNPIVFEVIPPEPGSYSMLVRANPVGQTGGDQSSESIVVVDSGESPPDDSNGENGDDGGFWDFPGIPGGGDGNGDGNGDGGGALDIGAWVITHPVEAGIGLVVGSVAIKEAIGGE